MWGTWKHFASPGVAPEVEAVPLLDEKRVHNDETKDILRGNDEEKKQEAVISLLAQLQPGSTSFRYFSDIVMLFNSRNQRSRSLAYMFITNYILFHEPEFCLLLIGTLTKV